MRALWTAPPALELEVESAEELQGRELQPGRPPRRRGRHSRPRCGCGPTTGRDRSGSAGTPPNPRTRRSGRRMISSSPARAEAATAAVRRSSEALVDPRWHAPAHRRARLARVLDGRAPAPVRPDRAWARGRSAGSSSGPGGCRMARRSCSTACPPRSSPAISDLVAAPDGSGWVVARGSEVSLRPFGGGGPERLLEVLEADASVAPFGTDSVLVQDEAGNARLWSFGGGGPRRVWAIRRPAAATKSSPGPGRAPAGAPGPGQAVPRRCGSSAGCPGRGPSSCAAAARWYDPDFAFHPSGDWCVATTHVETAPHLVAARTALPQRRRGLRRSRATASRSPSARTAVARDVGWEEGRPAAAGARRRPRRRCGSFACRSKPSAPTSASTPRGAFSSSSPWSTPGSCRSTAGRAVQVIPAVDDRQIEQGAISPTGARVASAYFIGEGPFDPVRRRRRHRRPHDLRSARARRTTVRLARRRHQPRVPRRADPPDHGLGRPPPLGPRHRDAGADGGERRSQVDAGEPDRRHRGRLGLWARTSPRGLELIDLATGTSRPLRGLRRRRRVGRPRPLGDRRRDRQRRRHDPGRPPRRRRAAPAAGPHRKRDQRRHLPRPPLGGLGRRGRHPPPVADAGPVEAAAAHPAARRAAGEAPLADQPARRARPRLRHRLDDRARPLPRLGDVPTW